jgi:hypothetical protein
MTTINSRPGLNGNSPKDYVEAAGILLDAAATVEAALRAMTEILHGRNYQHVRGDFDALDARNQDVLAARAVLDHEAIRQLALAIHQQSKA